MMSKLFCAAATMALVSAQKFHGREEIECAKEHAVMGVGGRCHCADGFKMQRLLPNAQGERQECVPTSMFNPMPQCPVGHECNKECFDGIDNDGDGTKDCEDKDCQFDPLARSKCRAESHYGKGASGECSMTTAVGHRYSEAEDELRRIERYCCPGGKCDKVPDQCSPRCSRVFIPFWRDCGAAFKTRQQPMDPQLLKGMDDLWPICQKVEQSIQRQHQMGDDNAKEVCTYAHYLGVTLSCASYIDGAEKLSFGNTEFCHTKCFEEVHELEEKCGERLTELEKAGVSQILPYMSQCEHMVVRPPTGGWSHVRCDVERSTLLIERECGKNLDTICGSTCSGALKRMSNTCAQDPAFQKYEQVQDKCHDVEEDKGCKMIAGHFTQIFQNNCCGKDGCKRGLPNTCSASCADSFLPFFSRCGNTEYGKELEMYGNMNKFAATCARSKGRETHEHGNDNGALPHVPGPNKDDQCSSIATCGECKGVCGWCRKEATQQQLAGTPHHQGWCSSTCTTTRGECGRGKGGGH